MTFEEFFAKKKIDLEQLAKAEPGLFTEFKSHFALMGEKSFDHTKKFWFNKLRRLYHLTTPEKAVTQLETKIASQAEALSSPTIEQHVSGVDASTETKPVAKPAFRPRNFQTKPLENKEESATPQEESAAITPVKKTGFKPRNIPAANKEAEDAKSLESRPGKTEVSDTPVTNPGATDEAETKPAYKPRFNLKNIPKNPAGAVEQTGDTVEKKEMPESTGPADGTENAVPSSEPAKPAYKPRFNMKNVGKAKEEPQAEIPDIEKSNPDQKLSEPQEVKPEGEASKPAAYKPKFNIRNVAAKKQEGPQPAQAESADVDKSEEEKPAPAASPSGYKPRFNMKNLPKSNPVEENPEKEDAEANTAPDPDRTEEIKPQEPEVSKPAYKPRFNIRNIKPKSQGEE